MNFDIIARVAQRKINDAIEEGAFDNLPGKGQPVSLDDDTVTPPHLRVANKVLKNAGVLPDWVQTLKDLQAEREEVGRFRAKLEAENRKRRVALEKAPSTHVAVRQFAEWHVKSRAEYHRRLKSANDLILKLSLMAPSTVQPPNPFRIALEMETFDAAFPPLPQQSQLVIEAPTPERVSTLRGAALECYDGGKGGGPIGEWLKKSRFFRPHSRDEISAGQETHSEDIRNSDAP